SCSWRIPVFCGASLWPHRKGQCCEITSKKCAIQALIQKTHAHNAAAWSGADSYFVATQQLEHFGPPGAVTPTTSMVALGQFFAAGAVLDGAIRTKGDGELH